MKKSVALLVVVAALVAAIGLKFGVPAGAEGAADARADARVDARVDSRAEPQADKPSGELVALSDDPSAAKVSDVEGAAFILRGTATRWIVASERERLFAGDLLKTSARGANAVSFTMKDGSKLIVGPGAQVEFVTDHEVKLIAGELEAVAGSKTFAVYGPQDQKFPVSGSKVYRVIEMTMAEVAEQPRWLNSYKSNTISEAMGSLLAKVDGRDVALTIGEYAAYVEIRDQIARTVIEQQFVNHTDQTLEGVFYFPLPADASISGFAMWIGSEIVEADIVEKERAREIYETLLREKKDPGLLEWTGANLFKARVFPIHHTKRIRITYTQVLKKSGDSFRYGLALQSEMLRATPLKKISVDVKVWSQAGLSAVRPLSHACRVSQAARAARVEFNAEEYRADRDFEVEFETPKGGAQATLIAHQRAEDGYFMLQIGSNGAADLERQAARKARTFLVVADTSASMAGPARDTQVAFIAGLLEMLGEGDKFNLALADVGVTWAFDAPVRVSAESRAEALKKLEQRFPMGWTDLDGLFDAAFSRAGKDCEIVYAGDGVPTAGDSDAAAFVARVKDKHSKLAKDTAVHAVAPGSSFDANVMRALGGLAGGSTRQVTSKAGALDAAGALLRDVVAPGLRDLKVGFGGLEVAAVYPGELPNLSAGEQQVVVGRYNPTGGRSGTVTVTGSDGGVALSIARAFEVPKGPDNGPDGNSFIPRLWAKAHMDHLMSQGRSAATKQQVIALSEDFQIITPYTSLLVLETDELRQRFAVQKRMRMRDGEEFFAKGREEANYELKRRQLLLAKQWRANLRNQAIEMFKGMGRGLMDELSDSGELSVGYGDVMTYTMNPDGASVRDFEAVTAAPVSGGAGGSWGGRRSLGAPKSESKHDEERSGGEYDGAPSADARAPMGNEPSKSDRGGEEDAKKLGESHDADDEQGDRAGKDSNAGEGGFEKSNADPAQRPAPGSPAPAEMPMDKAYDDMPALKERSRRNYDGGDSAGDSLARGIMRPRPPQPETSLAHLFPWIGTASELPPAEPKWPDAIRELMLAVDKRRAVMEMKDGRVSVKLTSSNSNAWDVLSGVESVELLTAGADSWHYTSLGRTGDAPRYSWVEGGERGVIDGLFGFGRTRKSKSGDERDWPMLSAAFFGLVAPERAFSATHEEVEGGRVKVTISFAGNADAKLVATIDRAKQALLEMRVSYKHGSETVTLSGHVQVAGQWWPALIETVRVTEGMNDQRDVVKCETSVGMPGLSDAIKAARERAFMLGELPKTRAAALAAVGKGENTLEQRWKLFSHHAALRQWEKAQPHLDALYTMLAGKNAVSRLRIAVLRESRANEDALGLIMAEARRVVGGNGESRELAVARWLLGEGSNNLGWPERSELLEILTPVIGRFAARKDVALESEDMRLNILNGMGRYDAAFELQKEQLKRFPRDLYRQVRFAQTLAGRGDIEGALAHLDALYADKAWTLEDRRRFVAEKAQVLEQAFRLEDLVAMAMRLSESAPDELDENVLGNVLDAYVRLDRVNELYTILADWMKLPADGKLSRLGEQRMRAAVKRASPDRYGYRWNTRRDKGRVFTDELAVLSKALLEREELYEHFEWVMSYWSPAQTEQGRAIFPLVFAKLDKGLETQAVARVASYMQVLSRGSFKPSDQNEPWEPMVARIVARWEKEAAEDVQEALAALVFQFGNKATQLAFARRDFARATTLQGRGRRAVRLFGYLVDTNQQPRFSEANAREALGLIQHIVAWYPIHYKDEQYVKATLESDSTLRQRTDEVRVRTFQRLIEWQVGARAADTVAAIKDSNLLPRRELALRQKEADKAAEVATRDWLAAVVVTIEPFILRQWAALEGITLDARLGTDPAKVAERAKSLAHLRIGFLDKKELHEFERLEQVHLIRCLITWGFVATREKADPAMTTAYLTFLREQAAAAKDPEPLRRLLVQALIALDRGDELTSELKAWFGDGSDFVAAQWGSTLSQVLAERDQLAAAVETLRKVEATLGLPADEWSRMAGWLMALDDKAGMKAAQASVYDNMQDWQLDDVLGNYVWRFESSGTPKAHEIDEDMLVRLRVLLKKTSWPQNYMWQVGRLYAATHDYRVPESIALAITGQTPGRIYNVLSAAQSAFGTIPDEAVLDRLYARLAELEKTVTSATDKRALKLLEFVIALAATNQSNGAEPHAGRAAAALKAAWREDGWLDGEPVLYSGFLVNIAFNVRPGAVVDEQLKQLGLLTAMTKPGSYDRITVSSRHAAALHAAGRIGDAITLYSAALDAFRQAQGGAVPSDSHEHLQTLANYMTHAGRWQDAEKLWRRTMSEAKSPAADRDAQRRLYSMMVECVRGKGSLTSGSAILMFNASEQEMQAAIAKRTDEDHSRNVVGTLSALYQAGQAVRLGGMSSKARYFAYQLWPKAAALYQYRNAQGQVSTLAYMLREVASAAEAVEYYVTRAEAEPTWLLLEGEDFWAQHSWSVASIMREYKPSLSDSVSARLLAIVLNELEYDLAHQHRRSESLYGYGWNEWSEKRPDFRATAISVLKSKQWDEGALLHICRYLWSDAAARTEAVAALEAAHSGGRLSEGGRSTLASWLMHLTRHGQAAVIYESLVKDFPNNLNYRTALMRCLHNGGKKEQVDAVLKAADAYFHLENRWNERAAHELSKACLECAMEVPAEAYIREAIALNRKGYPAWAEGNTTRASYYDTHAKILTSLGRTMDAIDAASGAVICWGNYRNQRQAGIKVLEDVMEKAADKPAIAAMIEKQVAETGLENPIMRRALGKAYAHDEKNAEAAAQFRVALEANPDDADLHVLLIGAYREMGDRASVISAMRGLIESLPRAWKLYADLADELVGAKDAAEARRTALSLADVSTNESEGRAVLATWMEYEGDAKAAIEQWAHVVRVREKSSEGYLGKLRCLVGLGMKEEAEKLAAEIKGKEWANQSDADVAAKVSAALNGVLKRPEAMAEDKPASKPAGSEAKPAPASRPTGSKSESKRAAAPVPETPAESPKDEEFAFAA